MDHSTLSFKLLPQPPSKKVLRAFEADAGWSLSKQAFDKVRDKRPAVCWVSVLYQDEQIGLAQLELAPPEFCYLSHLVINSRFRHQGIGRWFLAHIERMSSSLGIKRLLLTPEPRSLDFYRALDFEPDPYVSGVLKKDVFLLSMGAPRAPFLPGLRK